MKRQTLPWAALVVAFVSFIMLLTGSVVGTATQVAEGAKPQQAQPNVVRLYRDDNQSSPSWTHVLTDEGTRFRLVTIEIPADWIYADDPDQTHVRFTASAAWTNIEGVWAGINPPEDANTPGTPGWVRLPLGGTPLDLQNVPGYPRCPSDPIGKEKFNDSVYLLSFPEGARGVIILYRDDSTPSPRYVINIAGDERPAVEWVRFEIPVDDVYRDTSDKVRYTASGADTDAYEIRLEVHPQADATTVGQPRLLGLPYREFVNLEHPRGYPPCPDFPIGSEPWNDWVRWIWAKLDQTTSSSPTATATANAGTATPTVTRTASPSATATATAVQPTGTATQTPTVSATWTATTVPSATPTATRTPEASATWTATAVASATPTATATYTGGQFRAYIAYALKRFTSRESGPDRINDAVIRHVDPLDQ